MPASTSAPPCQAHWDAGDLGCGELVMELMIRLRQLDHGEVLRLTASDPGAAADIPAWCRLTGHSLCHVDAASNDFFIQRK